MNNYNIAAYNGDAKYGGANSPIQLVTADITLSAADAGKTFLVATDGLTITLPATIAGCQYTFINHGAAGNNIITVAPQSVDGIAGTITLASSVVTRVGTVNTALVNTKATSTKGNAATIIGTGVTGTGAWYIKESTGIWA